MMAISTSIPVVRTVVILSVPASLFNNTGTDTLKELSKS